jgi:hypothetical protein
VVLVQSALGALPVLPGMSALVTPAPGAPGALLLGTAVALGVGALPLERRHDNVVPIRPPFQGKAAGWR